MKDDYLIVSREWSDGLHCPTLVGDLGVVPLGLEPLEGDLAFFALFFLLDISSSFSDNFLAI